MYSDNENVYLAIQGSFTVTANALSQIATINTTYKPQDVITLLLRPDMHNVNVQVNNDGKVYIRNDSSATSLTARTAVVYPLLSKLP